MPLRRRPAAGEQQQRVFVAGRFRHGGRFGEQESSPAVGVKEAAVGEQTAFDKFGMRSVECGMCEWSSFCIQLRIPHSEFRIPTGPLHAAAFVNLAIVRDAGDVARLVAGDLFQDLE